MNDSWQVKLIDERLEYMKKDELYTFSAFLDSLCSKSQIDYLSSVFYGYLAASKKFPRHNFEVVLQLHINYREYIDNNYIIESFNNLITARYKAEHKIAIINALITHLTADNIETFNELLADIHRKFREHDLIYQVIINYSDKLEQIANKKTKMIFLESFLTEFVMIYKILVPYYLQFDHERALSILSKLRYTPFEPQEKINYLKILGQAYNLVGSKNTYIKCLSEILLLGQLEVYDELKELMTKRELNAVYDKLLNNLIISNETNIYLLHSILIKECDIDNLIKYQDYWNDEMIIEDIQYFKLVSLPMAAKLYANHILSKAKKMSPYKTSIIISHLKDLRKIYGEEPLKEVLPKLKNVVTEIVYQEIINNL